VRGLFELREFAVENWIELKSGYLVRLGKCSQSYNQSVCIHLESCSWWVQSSLEVFKIRLKCSKFA
jgi:hypothetical protein